MYVTANCWNDGMSTYSGCIRGTSRIKSSGYSNISGLHAFGRDRKAFKLKCEIHGQLLYCHISYVFENHHHYSCPFAESTKGRMSNSVRCGFHPNLMQTFSYNYWMILNTERNHVIKQPPTTQRQEVTKTANGNWRLTESKQTSVISMLTGSPVMEPSEFW